MFAGINWDEIAAALPAEEQEFVDFEYELYGRKTYRRDAEYFDDSAWGEPDVDGALRLLAELDGICEDRGHRGMEKGHAPPTATTTCTPSRQTTETISRAGSHSTIAPLSQLQLGRSDRRCTPRPDRVHCVWPDPASGCVYGGSCALLPLNAKPSNACVHPLLQPSGVLPYNRSLAPRREYTRNNRRRPFPFASRSRWERGYGRVRKPVSKKPRSRKKVQKA
jgi:hypothetical protein